jgi:ABC-type branched-subunit amino acid transport system ATPase component
MAKPIAPLLETRSVGKSFGALAAVSQANLSVEAGKVHSIIGPNGAGKTTLFNLLVGVFPPTSGKILFEGRDISSLKLYERARIGIGRSYQVTSIFPELSVHENVRLAVQSRGRYNFSLFRSAASLSEFIDRADAVLEEMGLLEFRDQVAATIPYGSQRSLDVAIALATGPKLLLLDEPTSGMSPDDTRNRTGRADFPEVHRHPDRAPHEGRHVDLRYHHGSQPGPDPGRGSAVRNSAQRGGPPRLSGRRQKRMGLRPPLLQLEDIHTFYGKSHIIQGVSFNVQAQECVALLGRNGAGKTTTLRSVIGLVPPRGGRIVFNGKPINGLKPHEISRRGIGYVPEDRQIFASLTVLENLTISIQPKRAAGPWNLDRVFAVLPSLADRRKNRGSQLSGGEQQMLSIARALMTNPEILLLDEPSEGLAPLIVEKLLEMIQSLKQGGLTIVLVEQDVEATRGVADRYCILQQGQLVYQGDHAEFWSRPELQEKFLGV